MKKIKIISAICLSFILSIVLAACSSSATSGSGKDQTSVKLSANAATLEVGETLELTYDVTGKGKIEWRSENSQKAVVQNGVVTALEEGKTAIVARYGDAEDSCVINVVKQTALPRLIIPDANVKLIVGEIASFTLSATYKGKSIKAQEYGVAGEDENKTAEVLIEGDSLTVTAKSEGITEILVYARIYGVLTVEKMTVTVNASKPFITVANAKPTIDGYEVDVAAIENEQNIPTSYFPQATIWNGGVPTSGTDVEWSMEENDFIGVNDEGYYGKTFGSATLIGTYEGESVRLTVNCVRPTFKSDKYLTVELADGLVAENSEGNVESVTADGTEIFKTTDESGKIVFKLNALKTQDLNVEKTIVIATDKALYEYSGKIVTDIITDENELNEFLANSFASATASMSSNGYFILGDDIVCNGEYKSYDRYPFGAQSSNGFQGVFDGNGKIIKNLIVTGNYCGFIPMMGINGVLKDVIFLNGKLNGNGGFISCHSFGTLENVYIEASITDNSATVSMGDRRMRASVLASESTPNVNVKNVFVKYLNVVAEDESNAGHIFSCGDCKPDGLIVVGHGTYYSKVYGNFSDAKIRSYSGEAEFLAAKDEWTELAAGYSSLIFNVNDAGILPARTI